MITTTDSIEIQVENRHILDERLNAAVLGLQQIAMATGTQGILITRHKPGHYTAELSDLVPFGMTREIIH
ncbi:hypothetical protein QK292_01095 [Arthrobacter sp. AL08]|uniref:hypothetical protein n=1 Tax=Micrococcaceae TaxID=1268 RepID=UPI001CFF7183|nr:MULTISPECIES: hypothetical protein [Micrococcaceae]MCB5282860.1 hypothetical protein [Arthrobacter sp. ES1]MDI3240159.1 hypothetical protein [Arthrobacter sp. AL05]MDI3276169.1 hypothetical protein [Arthrobacter sp. AL08]MDJ0353825.1 hypothetical protein [Pseudarthrobacter sp. PH31-O2]WGZ78958.1 hypothetical protein QI450_14020 [Arthrobacter sp. EM1]